MLEEEEEYRRFKESEYGHYIDRLIDEKLDKRFGKQSDSSSDEEVVKISDINGLK